MRRATAKVITTMYVAGMHLPPNSPCLTGNEDKCFTELAPLFKDKVKAQAINNQAEKMIASLKVN